MSIGDRASKAQALTDDLTYQRQTNIAVVKRNIARKAKRQVTNYDNSFNAPLLDQPIPFDPEEFFYFCNHDLGFTLEEVPHKEICEELSRLFPDLRFPIDNPKLYGLILLPRNTYKTYICAIGLPLYIFTKNPNARGLVSAHRHDVSKGRLKSVKQYLERDAVFREKYGNWVPDFREEKWSEDAIVITARTQNLNDPSLDTCAVDRNKDGSHPDFVICDDVQSVPNASTPVMRAKVWEHIRALSPQLQPGGTMVVVGTRKHNQDAYGKIYKINAELVGQRKPPMFSILRAGAYRADGSLYFPSRLTQEFLESEKRLMGPRMFANEYLNEPIEDGAKMFTKDRLKMEQLDLLIDPLSGGGLLQTSSAQIPVYTTMVWDPAGHKPSETSDDHGLTVVGNDPNDHWWVVKAEGIKGVPNYVISRVSAFIIRYRPQVLGVESVFRQELWVYLLREHLQHLGIECPSIREIESKESKYGRIAALQPRVERGDLTLDVGCLALREQMLDYPEVEHDDLVDSLASHMVISQPSKADDTTIYDLDDEYYELGMDQKVDPRVKLGCFAGGSSTPSRL